MALNKEQKNQLALLVIALVGFPIVWWNYLMKPTLESIKVKQQENQEIEEKVETMKRTAARLGALEKEKDALLQEVSKAEKKLPKQRNIQEVYRVLMEEAQREKVYIGSFSPEAERAQSYFVEIPFGVSYSGNFHSVAKFLASMGQQERIMAARNLQMRAAFNAQKGQTMSGSFTLVAYIFKG
jgi:type IV pilus assembly protein PilO